MMGKLLVLQVLHVPLLFHRLYWLVSLLNLGFKVFKKVDSKEGVENSEHSKK
jgi:hypothetical protein